MKILFLSAANNIHTVRWVNALSDIGHDIYLVSLPNHKQDQETINKKIIVLYLKYSGNIGYYSNFFQLKNIAKQLCPDIINVHYASGYGTLARRARLPHVILSVWGSDVYDFPYQNWLNNIIIKANLKYAYKLASTSLSMANQVRLLLKNRDISISITPFGVDVDKFKPYEKTSSDNRSFHFGIVKALEAKYGIDTIIHAFSLFLKRICELENPPHLIIYGKGSKENEFRSLCIELGIQDFVFWKGYIQNSELPDVLNEFDIFCLGSRLDSESFGVAAVEAMACGLPVIATDVSGFKEVIEDGVSGCIVPRNNPEIYADKMFDLYQNPLERCRLGQNARNRVLDLYSWEENVKAMEKLYLESLSGDI